MCRYCPHPSLLVFATLACLPAAAPADESTLSVVPSAGVLILRNGYVLSGRITPQGDNYLVTLGDSGEVRLPSKQVELICGSLEEAYFIKRDRLDRFDLRGRLELAEWCLAHKLYARAADQILTAVSIDSSDPRIRVLRRRLRNAVLERQPSGRTTRSAGKASASEKSKLLLASLPAGAVEQYTQSVQPVLLNRCATNACHGSSGQSDLRLLRPRLGRTMTHRMTQRNLAVILKFVHPHAPEESPLLTKPTTMHGGLDESVFDETQSEQLSALIQWVHSLAAGQRGLPQRVAKPDTVLSQTQSNRFDWQKPSPPQVKPIERRQPGAATNEATAKPQPAGDPFDPEVFNRRYFPQKQRF